MNNFSLKHCFQKETYKSPKHHIREVIHYMDKIQMIKCDSNICFFPKWKLYPAAENSSLSLAPIRTWRAAVLIYSQVVRSRSLLVPH